MHPVSVANLPLACVLLFVIKKKKGAIPCVLWHVFHSRLNRSKWVCKPHLIIHFTTWLGLGVIKWNINTFVDNVYMCVISLEMSLIRGFYKHQLTVSEFWPLGLDFSKDGQLFLRRSPNGDYSWPHDHCHLLPFFIFVATYFVSLILVPYLVHICLVLPQFAAPCPLNCLGG